MRGKENDGYTSPPFGESATYINKYIAISLK